LKILISQTASLGDVILSTALIDGVSKKHPGAEIWFLSNHAGLTLLKSDKRLSGLIAFDKKSGLKGIIQKSSEIRKVGFDIVYAIQRSARVSILLYFSGIKERVGFRSSALPFLFSTLIKRPKDSHDVLRNYSLLERDDPEPEIRLSVPDSKLISEELKELATTEFIAIFPGSLWETKKWKSENFSKLATSLSEHGLKPIFFGSSSEKAIVDKCARASNSLSLAGKTDLQELIFMISKASVLVCNDSSSLHIASAFKIPTVAIFCSTAPSFGFGPWKNPKAIIVENKDLWCRPCARHGGDFCPTGTNACRSDSGQTSVDSVVKAVLQLRLI
jgi:heptosyltransferase-2